MRRRAVAPHMNEWRAGCQITVNAVCPGGHQARDVELREAREKCTGLDSRGVLVVNLEEKDENRALGGHWLVNERCRQDFGGFGDVAAMAVFIASDEARHFASQDVNTTCGYIMW